MESLAISENPIINGTKIILDAKIPKLPENDEIGKFIQDRCQEIGIFQLETDEDTAEDPQAKNEYSYTGTINLFNNSISAEVKASIDTDNQTLSLEIDTDNYVTVGSLSDLSAFFNQEEFLGRLPKAAADSIRVLSRIQLQSLRFEVSDSYKITATEIAVSLALDDLEIATGIHIHDISALISISNPLSKTERSTSVTFEADATLFGTDLSCTVALPERSGSAILPNGIRIPLARMGIHADVPDLEIESLKFDFNSDGSGSLTASIAKDSAWTLDLGTTQISISDVDLIAFRSSQGSFSGNFSGTVCLGRFKLDMSYDTDGDFSIHASLPEISLQALFESLGLSDNEIPLPSDLKTISFAPGGGLLIQKDGRRNLVVRVLLPLDRISSATGPAILVFELRKIGSTWGIAVGIDLNEVKLSGLPGLSSLSLLDNSVHLEQVFVVASTFKDPQFQLPDIDLFNMPTVHCNNLRLPPQSGGLIPGLNAYSRWMVNLDAKEQKLIADILGLKPNIGDQIVLDVGVQIGRQPAMESRLSVSCDTTLAGHHLIGSFGFQMQGGKPGLFLVGSLSTTIQGNSCQFDIGLVVVPTGFFISGSMKGSIEFAGITLSNMGLVIGADWAGIPSLGIAAQIDVGHFDSSLAVFFNSADPSQSMVAGSISSLSLEDIVETIAGADIPSELDGILSSIRLTGTDSFEFSDSDNALALALDARDLGVVSSRLSEDVSISSASTETMLVVSEPGKKWFLTDMTTMRHYEAQKTPNGIQVSLEPQIYIVPNAVSIGAINFAQGFFVDSALNILSFEASAKIDIQSGRGILVDGRMDKIVIGSASLFSISSLDGESGPKISASTIEQKNVTEPELASPHFLVDGQLSILGISRGTYAKLTKNGFEFELTGTLASAGNYDIHGHFRGVSDMSAGGNIDISVPVLDLGPLGRIDIGTGVKGALDIGVAGSRIWAKFQGEFQFAGRTVTLPRIDLDVHGDSLLDLSEKVRDLVEDSIRELLTDATQWAKWVKSGAIQGVDDLAGTLSCAYGIATAETAGAVLKAAGYTEQQATSILKHAGYIASDIEHALSSGYSKTKAEAEVLLVQAGFAIKAFSATEIGTTLQSVFGTTETNAASALKSAGYMASEVGGVLKSVYSTTEQNAANSLKAAGYLAYDVGYGLATAYGKTAEQATNLLKTAGYAGTEIGLALNTAFNSSAEQTAALLKGAGCAINEVGTVLDCVYRKSAAQAASVLKGAGYAASEVGNVLKSVYNTSADQAASVLKGAGYAASEVGSVLKSVYNTSADQAASILKGAGYAASEVGSVLKSVYNTSADQAASILKGAGYAASEVGSVLKSVYNTSADQAASILKGAGYAASEVGSVLKSVYNTSADQAASILKGAGYAASEVGSVLKSVYNTSADQAASILKGAGYAASEVGSVLKSVYNTSADQAASILKGAGYAASEVGSVLKSVYNTSADQAASVLKGAGYAASEVGNVLKSVYNATADQATSILKGAGYAGSEVASALVSAYNFTADTTRSVLRWFGF